jgi:hypothetical protein
MVTLGECVRAVTFEHRDLEGVIEHLLKPGVEAGWCRRCRVAAGTGKVPRGDNVTAVYETDLASRVAVIKMALREAGHRTSALAT